MRGHPRAQRRNGFFPFPSHACKSGLAIAAILAIVAGQGGCAKTVPQPGEPDSPRPILVSVAASTTDAMQTLADRFTAQSKVPVTLNADDSSKLAMQIVAGAPAAILLSANRKWAELVGEKGLALESTPLLGNQLVLIVSDGNPANVSGPADLTSPAVRRLALAGPTVPAGMYARDALARLGLLSALEGKIVDGDNVRVALTFVERGEAEAGIVYATDAKIAGHVQVVAQIEPSLHEPIVYPLVLLKEAQDDRQARQFFEYLQSPDAAAVFQQFGFLWLPGE
jgi:molybdate transport system substrate-binding protein